MTWLSNLVNQTQEYFVIYCQKRHRGVGTGGEQVGLDMSGPEYVLVPLPLPKKKIGKC